jgi:hypothetical protein
MACVACKEGLTGSACTGCRGWEQCNMVCARIRTKTVLLCHSAPAVPAYQEICWESEDRCGFTYVHDTTHAWPAIINLALQHPAAVSHCMEFCHNVEEVRVLCAKVSSQYYHSVWCPSQLCPCVMHSAKQKSEAASLRMQVPSSLQAPS